MKDFLNEEIKPGDILLHINLTKNFNAPHIVVATNKISKTGRLTVNEFYNSTFVKASFNTKSLIKISPEKLKNLILERKFSLYNPGHKSSKSKYLNSTLRRILDNAKNIKYE